MTNCIIIILLNNFSLMSKANEYLLIVKIHWLYFSNIGIFTSD